GCGRAGVQPESEVDDEDLPLPSLEVEDTVVAEALDAGDGQFVHPGPASRRGSVASRRHTARASVVARTSCTRTPQTPLSASSTVRAEPACSRWSTGRGVPSSSASRVPRKLLREAPTSTGS